MARIATAGSLLALSLLIGTAQAAPDEHSFKYDRSELATPGGPEKLYQRIEAYARSQCSTISTPAIANPRAEKCTRDLVNEFVAQIDEPVLSQAAKSPVKLLAVER